MPTRKTDKTSNPTVRNPAKRTASQGNDATMLPESMINGKASSAKAADGNKPVYAQASDFGIRDEPVPHALIALY
jgi:hypothetical protein